MILNNEMRRNGIKKISKKMWIVFFILSFLLLIFGGYILIKNLTSGDWNRNSKNSEETEKTKKETDFYTLISSLNITGLPSEYFGYFFKKDSYQTEEISNQVKIYMAIRKIMAEDPTIYQDSSRELSISLKQVEQSIEELFGKNAKLKHESLIGNSCSYSSFIYNKDKKQYIQKPGECEDEKTMSILMEQESTVHTEEKEEFIVWIAFVDFSYDRTSGQMDYQYYKDANKIYSVGVSEKYELEPFKESVNRYRFTFTKEDSHYIFDKVELINQ